MDLPISNVINISVSQVGAGAGEYNTSNLAIFSREVFASSFGTDGFKIFLEPTEIGTDFGTSSATYAMGLGVFSQQPNILANQGYLVIIPFSLAAQSVKFATTPTTGVFKLTYNGNATADIAYNATSSDVQTALRLVSGLSAVTVTGSYTTGFIVTMTGVTNPLSLGVSGNTTTKVLATQSTETLDAAVTRTSGLVQYFGLMAAEVESQTVMLATAAVVQALNKIVSFVSYTATDVDSGGMLDLLTTGGFTKSRGLFYGDRLSTALVFMASYMGRGLSTNFDGSNTTQNMHLKDLSGVQPDPSMTQTLLNKCIAAGADTYVSIQGVAKVFCSGANRFFDQVYNLGWYVGALQIAGFNILAQTSTKISQTEDGVGTLKGGYRTVCEQAVTNQYAAPGAWNSPTSFGNQADLISNVAQRGYYIYSAPVSQQSAAARAARQAPLIQIALKEAGAIDSSTVIVNVNA